MLRNYLKNLVLLLVLIFMGTLVYAQDTTIIEQAVEEEALDPFAVSPGISQDFYGWLPATSAKIKTPTVSPSGSAGMDDSGFVSNSTGYWSKGNLSKNWRENDYVSYVLSLEGYSPALLQSTVMKILYDFHFDNNDAIFIDLLRNFSFKIVPKSSLGSGNEPPATLRPTNVFSGNPLGSFTPFNPTRINVPSINTNGDSTTDNQINPPNFAYWRLLPNSAITSIGTGNVLLIYFEAHLAVHWMWSNGLEHLLDYSSPKNAQGGYRYGPAGYTGSAWTTPHNGAGFTSGSSPQFRVVSEGVGNKTIPIPIPPAPPAGQIKAIKYNDLNGNGTRDAGEPPLAGWQMILEGQFESIIIKDTITTNSSGEAVFNYLVPTTYKLREIIQDGWIKTEPTADFYTINLNEDQIVTRSFGNFKTAFISGYKYNDLNGNGIDNSEPRLQGWEIRATKGSAVKTTTTDAGGNYSFTFAPSEAGPWIISETVQSGWSQTDPGTPGTYTVNVSSGTNEINKRFGNFQTASISGYKYNDMNGNGSDDTEPRLQGWEIKATKGSDIRTTHTDASGNYSFTFGPSEAGSWIISETVQSGWSQTDPGAPGTYAINVSSGTNEINKRFGNFQPASITGFKFEDVDSSATYNAADHKLADWIIILKKNGIEINRDTTDGNGVYFFGNLLAGTYTVEEELIAGWVQTFPASLTYTVDLIGGQNVSDKNFGNFNRTPPFPGNISGKKFHDLNKNGAFDTGEPGLSGWKITLLPEGIETITNGNGEYLLNYTTAGSHVVFEEQQNGWIQTYPNPNEHNFFIPSGGGSNFTDLDFGNFKPPQIVVRKFNDFNGDGIFNNNDVPIENWKMTLTPGNVEQFTNQDGYTTFTVEMPGEFTVTEEDQEDWKPTTDNSVTVNVVGGDSLMAKEFGNYKKGKITAKKYNDLTGNGLTEDDEELTGVFKVKLGDGGWNNMPYTFEGLAPGIYTVTEQMVDGWANTSELSYDVIIASGDEKLVTFTNYKKGKITAKKYNDLTGNRLTGDDVELINVFKVKLGDGEWYNMPYTFEGLAPGIYTVTEQMVAGWVNTSELSYDVVIASGDEKSVTFTNFKTVKITGYKKHDINGDGNISGDPGLQSWTIRATKGDVVKETTTNNNGYYEFTFGHNEAGNWIISEVLQSGWIQTYPAQPGNYLRKVESGAEYFGLDFGNFKTIKISGYKWNDLNRDGMWQQASEPPLDGWTIKFKNGSIVGSTITNIDGYYEFIGMVPGSYCIYEVQQNGWQRTFPNPDSCHRFTAASGVDQVNRNFGNFSLSLFCTYTMGGWGSPPRGHNPGMLREMYFDEVFPNDLWLGLPHVAGKSHIRLTTSTAVMNFLPNGGKPIGLVNKQLVDPDRKTVKNTLAGQLAAAKLNVGFDSAGKFYKTTPGILGDMIVAKDKFAGKTVRQLIAIGDTVLGGGIVSGITAPIISDALGMFNENFGDCKPFPGRGFLIYPNGFVLARAGAIENEAIPEVYSLNQNYPNPFNPFTTIAFGLPEASRVELLIYNILGQEVARVVDAELPAGYQTAVWNGLNSSGMQLSSGVYFYKLSAKSVTSAKEFTEVRKLMLVR